MIQAEDAIRVARSFIGTPYDQMDCMGLIRAVIKQAPGGVKDYRCEGTNWLWDSIKNSGKYQHVIARQEGLAGVTGGMLPMKRYGKDGEDHVGIATGIGTVIHSSSVKGYVVETPLTPEEGWDLLVTHRYITPMEGSTEEIPMISYVGRVVLTKPDEPDNHLNVRNEPSTKGRVVGKLGHNARVVVQAKPCEGWLHVSYGDNGVGFVSEKYIEQIADEPQEPEPKCVTILINDDGETMTLDGVWRVAVD